MYNLLSFLATDMKWNEWCFRPQFCICKAIVGRGQHEQMRSIVVLIWYTAYKDIISILYPSTSTINLWYIDSLDILIISSFSYSIIKTNLWYSSFVLYKITLSCVLYFTHEFCHSFFFIQVIKFSHYRAQNRSSSAFTNVFLVLNRAKDQHVLFRMDIRLWKVSIGSVSILALRIAEFYDIRRKDKIVIKASWRRNW